MGHSLKGPGLYEISGIAYSGTGRIEKVMVSADGGQSWAQAALQGPVLSKAFTRFRLPWRWDGGPATLLSRAWDESGEVQPTRAEFIVARGQLEKPRRFWDSTISTTIRSPVGVSVATGRSSMSTLKRAIFTASLCLAMTAGAASGETPNFGKPIDEASIAPWDISILPDGTGLPKGSGTPAQGAPIFAEKCSGCHGENGKGGEAAALVSDKELIGINAAQKPSAIFGLIQPRCSISFAARCRFKCRIRLRMMKSTHSPPTFSPAIN